MPINLYIDFLKFSTSILLITEYETNIDPAKSSQNLEKGNKMFFEEP